MKKAESKVVSTTKAQLPILAQSVVGHSAAFERIVGLISSLTPREYAKILDSFQPPRNAQMTWFRKVMQFALKSQPRDFSLRALDELTLHGNAAPLAEILALCPTKKVVQQFGIEVATWAWVNRVSRLPSKAYRKRHVNAEPEIDPLRKFLTQRGIDGDSLDTLAHSYARQAGYVNVEHILQINQQLKDQMPWLAPKVASFAPTEKTLQIRLLKCCSPYLTSNGVTVSEIKKLFATAFSRPIPNFSIESLDDYARKGNQRALLKILSLCPPEALAQEFGLGVVIWTWMKRDLGVSTRSKSKSKPPADLKNFQKFLIEKNVDIKALASLSRSYLRNIGTIDLAAVVELHRQVEARIASLVPPTTLSLTKDLSTRGRLLRCHRIYWSTHEVPAGRRSGVMSILQNLNEHLPQSVSLSDLEQIASSGKNPDILRFLVSSVPPEYIAEEFGREAKELLIWTAINFSGAHSRSHHIDSKKENFERLMRFVARTYDVDYDYFGRAQYMTWIMCQGSVDFEVVMANYKLLLSHDWLGKNNRREELPHFPTLDILRKNKLAFLPNEKLIKYGASKLSIKDRLDVEGPDASWAKRSYICRDQGVICLRKFEKSVRIESPVGLALTHENDQLDKPEQVDRMPKVPIAVVSYYCHRSSNGRIELVIAQMQGTRPELWLEDVWFSKRSPNALKQNFREILVDMARVVADRLELPWVIRGGKGSKWKQNVEKTRTSFDDPLSKMVVDDIPLVKNVDGNFGWPRSIETSSTPGAFT